MPPPNTKLHVTMLQEAHEQGLVWRRSLAGVRILEEDTTSFDNTAIMRFMPLNQPFAEASQFLDIQMGVGLEAAP